MQEVRPRVVRHRREANAPRHGRANTVASGEARSAQQERLVTFEAIRLDELGAQTGAVVALDPALIGHLAAARRVEGRLPKLREEEASYDAKMAARAAELAALEQAEMEKLEALRRQVAEQKAHLGMEREKNAAHLRQIDFVSRQAVEKGEQIEDDEEEISQRERAINKKQEEVSRLIKELKRQQKLRVATIAAGIVLLLSTGAYAFQDEVVDFFKPGHKIWTSHMNGLREKALRAKGKSPELLRHVANTERRFQKAIAEKPETAVFRSEKSLELIKEATEAVEGALAGWADYRDRKEEEQRNWIEDLKVVKAPKPAELQLEAMILTQLAIQHAGRPDHVTYALIALDAIDTSARQGPAYPKLLEPHLTALQAGLTDHFVRDRDAFPDCDTLGNRLKALNPALLEQSSDCVLLAERLLAEADLRQAGPAEADIAFYGAALAHCLDALAPANAPIDRGDRWQDALFDDVERIVERLQQDAPTSITTIEQTLKDAANEWNYPLPYLLIARRVELPRIKFERFYEAKKLGDQLAKALEEQPDAGAAGQERLARTRSQLLEANAWVGWGFAGWCANPDNRNDPDWEKSRQDALALLQSARVDGEALGWRLSAEAMRAFPEAFEPGGGADMDQAIEWASRAHQLKNAKGTVLFGQLLVERAHRINSRDDMLKARALLEAFTESNQVKTEPAAYYWLYLSYYNPVTFPSLDEVARKAIEKKAFWALQKGNEAGDLDCTYFYANWCWNLQGPAGERENALTKEKVLDLYLKAAALGHDPSREELEKHASDSLGNIRDWYQLNRERLRALTPPLDPPNN